VYSGTLLATLVYLEKLASKLPKNAEGLSTTLHRIFLACLIISSKFNNDSSPKNSHWADFTDGLFTVDDINLMERQLLNLLNWDVQVSNADLSRCLRVFIEPIKNDLKNAQRMRRSKPKSQLQSSPQQQQSSIRPPLQSPPISPVSYKDVMHTHQRSASVASTSSLSSSSSFSSIESISETDYKLNAVPVAKPILLYQPNSIKNVIEPAHSFKFDQRELENYVTYL
jgi:G1/S-specific cyclin PLC1